MGKAKDIREAVEAELSYGPLVEHASALAEIAVEIQRDTRRLARAAA